jgi:hypothetical protein
MDLEEIGIDRANWIPLAQDRVRMSGFCKHDNKLSGSLKKVGYF